MFQIEHCLIYPSTHYSYSLFISILWIINNTSTLIFLMVIEYSYCQNFGYNKYIHYYLWGYWLILKLTIKLWSIIEAQFWSNVFSAYFFLMRVIIWYKMIVCLAPPVPVVLYCRGEMTLRDLINFKINKIYQLSFSRNNSCIAVGYS